MRAATKATPNAVNASDESPQDLEIADYADAMADMFCAYLGRPPRQAAAPG